jgi:hypothetical protein
VYDADHLVEEKPQVERYPNWNGYELSGERNASDPQRVENIEYDNLGMYWYAVDVGRGCSPYVERKLCYVVLWLT